MWNEKKVLVTCNGTTYEVPVKDLKEATVGARTRPRFKRFSKDLRSTKQALSTRLLHSEGTTPQSGPEAAQLRILIEMLPEDALVVDAAGLGAHLCSAITLAGASHEVLLLGTDAGSNPNFSVSRVTCQRNRDERVAELAATCVGLISLHTGATNNLTLNSPLPPGQSLLSGGEVLVAISAHPFDDNVHELIERVEEAREADPALSEVVLYRFSWSDATPPSPSGWLYPEVRPLPTPILTALRALSA
jgi:hypothetical protein